MILCPDTPDTARQHAVDLWTDEILPALTVGHVKEIGFRWVRFDNGPSVVDGKGQFYLVAETGLLFLVHEKTLKEDIVRSLREAADAIERAEIDEPPAMDDEGE
jgi:hypothetical protein